VFVGDETDGQPAIHVVAVVLVIVVTRECPITATYKQTLTSDVGTRQPQNTLYERAELGTHLISVACGGGVGGQCTGDRAIASGCAPLSEYSPPMSKRPSRAAGRRSAFQEPPLLISRFVTVPGTGPRQNDTGAARQPLRHK